MPRAKVYETALISGGVSFGRIGPDQLVQFKPGEESVECSGYAAHMQRRMGGVSFYPAANVTGEDIVRLMKQLDQQNGLHSDILSVMDRELGDVLRREFIDELEPELAGSKDTLRLVEDVLFSTAPEEGAVDVEGALILAREKGAVHLTNLLERWRAAMPDIRRVQAGYEQLRDSAYLASIFVAFSVRGVFHALVVGQNPVMIINVDPIIRAWPVCHEVLALLLKLIPPKTENVS